MRRIITALLAVVSASAVLAGMPQSTSAAASGAPSQPAPRFPAPQPAPETASAHLPPPAPPAPRAADPGPAEGWTSFSHWTRNSNGSITQELYSGPAFRPTGGGAWQRVDPAVAPTSDAAVPLAADKAVRPIHFGHTASKIVDLGLDRGSVTLSSANLNIAKPASENNGVVYHDVAADTDLRYRVSPGGLKEELVLRSAKAPTSFTFHLSDPKGQLGEAKPADGGGYTFANVLDGDVAVTLPPAVAHDAQQTLGRDEGSANLSAKRAGDGYDLTVAVEPNWLQGKVFPVVLDPTIGFNASNSAVQDGTAYYTMRGCGGCTAMDTTGAMLNTGSYTDATSDMEPARSFVKFDLSQVPAGSMVLNARFGAFLGNCIGTSWQGDNLQGTFLCNSHNYSVELHKMNGVWGPGSTWSTLAPLMNGTTLSSLNFPAFGFQKEFAPTRYDFDLTSQTQSWVNSPATNFGFAMKVANEPATVGDAYYNIGGPAFESSDDSWVYEPNLTVTYTPPAPGPQSVSASAGNGSALVTWAPPADNGGPAPTGYVVGTYTAAGTLLSQTSVSGTTSNFTATGLTNGVTYKFAVAATNAAGTGASTFSNLVTVGAQPSITVGTTSDVTNTSGVMAKGQTFTYTVTVTNPGPAPITGAAVSDILPTGVLPTGTTFTSQLTTAVALPTQNCTATTSPACALSGSTVSISGLGTMAPNDKYVFTYHGVALGGDRGCSSVISVPSATVGANGSRATVPVTVCDSGLGMERWWSYVDRDLGPQSQAHLNPANGNLVAQATDSTPEQAHGHLGYVLRRSYNSQDSTVVPLPGSIGTGWNLNIGQSDDLIGDGVGPSGLYIPPLQSFLRPFAVTMIDRDGTRHVFTARSLGASSNWVDVTLLKSLSNPGLRGALIPNVLSVLQGGHRLCVDQMYDAPPGVHVSLWRYLDVTTTSGNCVPAINTTPVVLGFAAERPDRLRYEFSWNGRLLDMTDSNGVSLRYAYEGAAAPGANLGRLVNVYEPRSSCATGPSINTNCRAFRFNYSSNSLVIPPGQPSCANDPAGSSTVCIADPAGRITKYVLDGSSRLVKVVNADATSVGYGYGTCGGPANALCSVSDPRAHSSSFAYSTPLVGLPRMTSLSDRRDTQSTVAYQRPDYVTFDTAGANRFTGDTPSQRKRFLGIDATGRVGEIDEGDPNDNYVRRAEFTWDNPGSTCRQPDNVVDNNACHVVRRSLSIFGADEDTYFVYGAEGQLLSKRQVTAPEDVKSTSGYHAQYVAGDGTVTPYDDAVAGGGNVTSANGSGGKRAQPNTLFAISDRTQALPPRGNGAGATVATYLTTYKVDNNSSVSPNAVPALNTCTNPSSPSANTGNLCETDGPAFNSSGAPTVSRNTYDPYGQKLTMTSPKAVAEGGQPYQYTYYGDGDLDLSGGVSAGGWLKGVTDPTGKFVAFAYDKAGNVVRTWDRNATQGKTIDAYPGSVLVPASGNFHETLFGPYANAPTGATAYSAPWRYLLSDRDPIGNLTTYAVDQNGNQASVRPPRGNAAGNSNYDTTQTFDNNNNLLATLAPQEKAANQPDGQDHPTTFAYDPFNNRTSTTDGRGMMLVNRYDRVNRQGGTAWTRGANGSTTVPSSCVASAGPDEAPLPAGRIACRNAIGHDGVDDVVAIQDGNHQLSFRVFDGAHRETVRTFARNDGVYGSTETHVAFDLDGHPVDVCSAREFDSTLREPDASNACGPSSKLATHNTYDAAGRLASATTYRDPTHPQTVRKGYDADGNPISATDPDNHVPTTAVYDLLDRKVSASVPRDGNVANNNVTTWTYDPAGNTTAVTKPGSPSNRITAYAYDADNRLTDKVVGADNPVVALAGAVDAQGSKNIHTRALYDADGHVVANFDARAFDPAEGVATPNPAFMARTDFDLDGRPAASFVPRTDSAASGRHDDLGLVDPSGQDRQTTQCPTSISPGPQSVGGVPSYPSSVGVCVTRVTFDAAGNRSTLTLPTATNSSSNRKLDFVYTDDNLVLAVCGPAPGGSNQNPSSCAGSGNTSRVTTQSYAYDAENRVVSTTDALGHWKQTSYYSDGLVQDETVIPNGANTHVTHHTYDASGNPKTVTDPQGNVTTTSYFDDNLKRDMTDGAADKTSYTYDGEGNPATVRSPSANALDPNNTSGTPTINTYTADNLLLTATVPVTPDGLQRRRTTYGYDGGGRKLSQHVEKVNASGGVLADAYAQAFTWFPDDRQEKQLGRDDPALGTRAQITTAYDPAGNKTSITDSTGGGSTVTATYFLDGLPRTVGDGTRTTRASYDGGGARYSRRDDTGSTYYPTSYAFNDAGDPTSMKSSPFPGNAGDTNSFTYDAAGKITQRVDQNTRISDYSYNLDDSLASVNFYNPGGPGTPVARWDYTYRKDFRIATQAFSGYGATGNAQGLGFYSQTYSYGYDGAGRVNSFTPGTDPTRAITWDHDGNRLSVPGKDGSGNPYTASQAYNADDTIAQRTDQYGTHAWSYSPWGGITNDTCTVWGYDGFDRTTSVDHCTLNPVLNTYDGLDRQRTANAGDNLGTRTLHYDGLSSQIATETSSTGDETVFELGVDGEALGRSVKSASPPAIEFFNDDGHGDITTLTSTATVLCTARFDPFGTPLNPANNDAYINDVNNACGTIQPNQQQLTQSAGNDQWFRGERRQFNDGDYQFGSRTYDPYRASFLTPDSYRAGDSAKNLSIGTDPLTRNTYSYVNGDPVNLADPNGHWGCWCWKGGWGGGGSQAPAAQAQPQRVYVGGGRWVNGPDNWRTLKPRQKMRWIAQHSSQADLDAFEHKNEGIGLGDVAGALKDAPSNIEKGLEAQGAKRVDEYISATGHVPSGLDLLNVAVNPAYRALDKCTGGVTKGNAVSCAGAVAETVGTAVAVEQAGNAALSAGRAGLAALSRTSVRAAETEAPLFSQTTASPAFRNGPFAGQSIGDVSDALGVGKISPADLPVDVITREGETIGLNTRSMLALRRAGVSPADWLINDVTGVPEMEQLLTERLLRNGLTGGTDVLRITGAGPYASSLR